MTFPVRIFLFLLLAFGSVVMVYADGSKDMYYPGVKGNRAFLVSGAARANNVLFNQAAHYVYVRVGETITVASSAQGVKNGHIVLTDPEGVTYNTRAGKIPNRQAEIDGPGVGYIPHGIPVEQPTKEGIWKVEFFPPDDTAPGPPNIRADADWTQRETGNLIAAWDVSVRLSNDPLGWIEGRVYFNVLNLYLTGGTLDKEDGAFYGKNYVLTKDGYIYRVDGNGSHGINFFYFVNSSGMLNQAGEPSYKSANTYPKGSYHNPNGPDEGLNVTQKMFYTFPNVDMPPNARGAVPDGRTWLYREAQISDVNVSKPLFFPIENNGNNVSLKGGAIRFETNYPGRYKLVIEPGSDTYSFARREIIKDVRETEIDDKINVLWDGLDGEGNFVPDGEDYPIAISIALIEGEIHFPYFDMEINPKGIKIERMNADGSLHGPAKVYWDDKDITPTELESERSNPLTNLVGSDGSGHGWGTYAKTKMPSGTSNSYNGNYGEHSFGNARAMDTWSYATYESIDTEENITVKKADLEIVSVSVTTASKDAVELQDAIDYTIVIRNNGPSDAPGARFEFDLPTGFYILNAVASSACGSREVSQLLPASYQLRAIVDLPNGCPLTYQIRATTGSTVPDATYGFVSAEVGIVRPPGFIDPDATSSNSDDPVPGSAQEECGAGCNNFKRSEGIFLLEPLHERGQLALRKIVHHIDNNGSGFQEEGDTLKYTFTIRNVGFVSVSTIDIDDKMLGVILSTPPGTVLDPGNEISLDYAYAITSADVARKYVENSANVLGKNPRGFDVKDMSGTQFDNDTPTRIAIDQKPVFVLLKQVINKGTGENGQFTIGDRIVYRFDIKHEGDVPVEDVQIQDAKISDEMHDIAPSVLSNQTVSYELEYMVTADDILQGQVENTASLRGKDQKYGNVLEDVSGQTFEDDLPTVTSLAKPPTGIADTFEIYQGHNGLFDVLANDIQGSSSFNPNSIEIVVPPALGAIVKQNGNLLYIPTDNFVHGEDSFVYRFSDHSRLGSQDTEVKISILRTIPVAVEDYYKVGYNYQIKLKPYENDYVEHSELRRGSIRITSYPNHGEIQNLGNGIFEYRPHLDYTGYDMLKYTIWDKNGNESKEAAVNIEVMGFFLPNTITPNGDGKNDTFRILGTYKFDNVELEIINRFGIRIFHSTDYRDDWIVPENIPEGTYFYIFKGVKNNEKPIVRKGSLLLKRETFGSSFPSSF